MSSEERCNALLQWMADTSNSAEQCHDLLQFLITSLHDSERQVIIQKLGMIMQTQEGCQILDQELKRLQKSDLVKIASHMIRQSPGILHQGIEFVETQPSYIG